MKIWNFRKKFLILLRFKNLWRLLLRQINIRALILGQARENFFKRELIKNIHFPEDLYIGEDACFLLKCIEKVHSINQIRVFSDARYNYRIIPTSAVRRYKADLLEQSIKQYNYILSQISFMNMENEKVINTAMNMFCWRILVSIKKNEMQGKKEQMIVKSR